MYNWNPPHAHELPARYWEPGADDEDMIRGQDAQQQSNGHGEPDEPPFD